MYRPLYNTRHTYASLMLSSGLFTDTHIADQLGHSVAMLHKHYAKYLGSAKEAQHSKLDLVFKPTSEKAQETA
jgi:integrase